MDVSVLASVASFVVSERVLKPKASVLVILGCILMYDLTTKTQDVSSLRVYRGPGLLAFSLMMVALSLRMWRRNGIACDELLFLPGTPHGAEVDDSMHRRGNTSHSRQQTTTTRTTLPEGDVAAGGTWEPTTPPRQRNLSRDSSVSSINEFLNSWDDDDDDTDAMADVEVNTREQAQLIPTRTTTTTPDRSQDVVVERLEQFRENHPRMTRIGTFFFFRSSNSTTTSAAYAPSGPSVMGAALDLSMPVLFNFHLFIEAWNHLNGSETPAKILPLIFLTVLIVRSVVPPGRRGRFWSTMKYTAMAPFHPVKFRDAYIGDILTTLVRPLQDVLFALAYYVTVLCGTITSNYSLSESSLLLQHSWLLHNVVLPSCALLPLWWKYLQTLRQAYDSGERWPHLGNAFKYLSAAIVILYGMTHREDRRSVWWIPAFGLALVYQIVWDTVMDWGLFEIVPRETDAMDVSEPSWLNRFSSVSPNLTWVLTLQRVVLPVVDALRLKLGRIPNLSQIRLRQTRLYKSEKFYWRIFVYNTAFRFCWMLCFIPAYHFSGSGRNKVTTFSSDTKSYVGVILPVAEIVRRTLWGFLHLEKETIRMHESGRLQPYSSVGTEQQDEEYEMSSVSVHSTSKGRLYLPPWLNSQQQMHQEAATISSAWNISKWFQYSEATRDKLFKAELSAWAVAFVVLGAIATT